MKSTNKLTFAAVCCALSIALLYVASLIKTGTIALEFIVGVALMLITSKSGLFYGIAAYVVTGVLGIFLLPDKSIALTFILFFGSLPVIKFLAEKKGRALEWIIKIVFLGAVATAMYFIFKAVLPSLPAIILILAVMLCGVLYDILLSYGFTFALKTLDRTGV